MPYQNLIFFEQELCYQNFFLNNTYEVIWHSPTPSKIRPKEDKPLSQVIHWWESMEYIHNIDTLSYSIHRWIKTTWNETWQFFHTNVFSEVYKIDKNWKIFKKKEVLEDNLVEKVF